MHLQALKFHRSKVFGALVALTASMGTMQATNLLTATSPITLTCSTTGGVGTAATVVVKPLTALVSPATLVVTFGSVTGGLVVTAPGSTTLTAANSTAGISYTVNMSPGCAGATAGSSTPHFQFSTGSGADVIVTANATVTATTSALVAAPSSLSFTCTKVGSVYTPGNAQNVSVTSAAPGGTPFTVDNSVAAPPSWLTVAPLTGGTATSSPTSFSATLAANCGSFAANTTNTGTIHLLNSPAPDKTIAVSLQVVGASPLTASPSSGSMSYVKASGAPGHVDVAVTSANPSNAFFSVNTSSLPIWLTVDSATGTAPKSIRFSSTSVADTLAPGTYSASVRLSVSGYGDLLVPISLLITNSAPRLTVVEGTTRNLNWVVGAPLPTAYITLVSTDSPVSYAITTAGSLAPNIPLALQTGLAYSFGSTIPVTFSPLIFATAQPGNVLTGLVNVSWGTPASSIVISFNVTVQSAAASLTAVSPASLPTASAGQTFTVSLIGNGFVPSTDPTQKTTVGIVVGSTNIILQDAAIAATVVNPSNITLTITVPASDANLPFGTSGAGGNVTLGVCNPSGGVCTVPTGTVVLSIGSNPIVQAVTSASSFVQVTPPTLAPIAPYDLISLFGTNFCTSGGTGCSSTQVLYSAVDSTTLRFGTTVSPDSTGPTQRLLSATFQTHGVSPTVIGTAPLLFASNNQINLIAPAALSTYSGQTVDVVVNFGYGSGATMKSSSPFSVSVVNTNPGIFTVGADGQGDGAILAANYSLISNTNPAGMRTTAADSDTVQIFMTGLGLPTSTASNASTGTVSGAVSPTDCITVGSYLTSLSNASGVSVTSADGAVLQGSLFNTNRMAPCMVTNPTATVGGVTASVTYAGWVTGSVAGLYQVNVRLPGRAAGTFQPATGPTFTNLLAPAYLPIVITTGGHSTQGSVNLWVAPQLKVVAPTALTGTVGSAWASSNNAVVASEGAGGSYTYAVTSGLLPSGLLLNAANGQITGTPAANTNGSYVVSVTATDSSNVPVTGTTTFTLTIAGGLFLTAPGAPFAPGATGTAYPAVTTVSAAGGTYPYTYATSSQAGITVDPNTGIVSVASTVANGTYTITINATDSTLPTPLTGSITFTIVIG